MNEQAVHYAFLTTAWVSAVVFGALAVVAFRAGPRRMHMKLWVAYCTAATAHLASMPIPLFVHTREAGEIWMRVALALGCVDQMFLILFALAFSRPIRGMRAVVGSTVVLAATLAILILVSDLVMAGVEANVVTTYAPVGGPAFGAYMLYVLGSWLLPFCLFIRNMVGSKGLRRTQSAYTVLALVLGLLGSFGATLPAMLEADSIVVFLPFLVFSLFPLTITYATVRYRLLDIRTVMHRTAVWLILSLAMVLPVFLTFRAVIWLRISFGDLELVGLVSALFLLGYLYLSKVKPRLDHLFERGRHDRMKVVEGFSRSTASLARPSEVAERLLAVLDRTLYAHHAVVLYRRQDQDRWERERGGTRPSIVPGRIHGPGDALSRVLVREGRALERGQLELDDRFADVRREALEYMDSARVQVMVPLVQGRRLTGVMLLGEKRNLRPYSREDLDLLDQLGASASVALSNSLLFEQVDEQRLDLEDLTASLEDKVAERTEELRRANEGLMELDRLKSRFFAAISHELRTPLTLILLSLRDLLDGEGDEDPRGQVQTLQDMRRDALELLRLINDIMDLSRLQESELKLNRQRVDLRGLASRVVDIAGPLARSREIQVSVEGGEGLIIAADGEKLERVIVNLVTNALKFTEPGGRVSVGLGRSGAEATIQVADSGIGIPPRELERIFDRFHQVEDGSGRSRGGTGIGLALVKELVELHGGRVDVQSAQGQGSTFTVTLPADGPVPGTDRVQEGAERPEPDEASKGWNDEILASEEYRYLDLTPRRERGRVGPTGAGGIKDGRLLLVDDNADVLHFLVKVLDKRYEVMAVQDGEQAWKHLLDDDPDLVVSDVMMPGISGLELCRRIKSDPRTQDTPVILLTARGTTEHRIEGHRVEADEYIVKPFEPEELVAAVKGLLSGRIRHAEMASRRHAQTLENLMAGMAHELRNAAHQMRSAHAVVFKTARASLASEGMDPAQAAEFQGRLRKMEGVVGRSLERISSVVSGIGHFAAGKNRSRWRELELDDVVIREVGVVGVPPDAHVDVRVQCGSGVRVRAPEQELRMTVINLVENAIKAVGRKGTVTVSTSRESGRAVLSVKDDGCGIDPADVKKIFDPFFTTRDPGEGMGLGLALSRRTAEDMGGGIEVRSRKNEGTEFIVRMPILRDSGANGS